MSQIVGLCYAIPVVLSDIFTVGANVVVIFVVIIDIDALEVINFVLVTFVRSQSVKLLNFKKLYAGCLSRPKAEVMNLTNISVPGI